MNAGKIFVYYGAAGGLGDIDRTPDRTASGQNAHDQLGHAAGMAGDVNGDGYADIGGGAPGYPAGGGYGKAYVYHGSTSGLAGDPAWTAAGEQAGDVFGAAVASAGDVNRDGYADLVVGVARL